MDVAQKDLLSKYIITVLFQTLLSVQWASLFRDRNPYSKSLKG